MAMTAIAVGAIAAPVIAGVIGSQNSAADRAAAQQAAAEAAATIQQMGAPPDLAKQIYYQKFQAAGVLTPELEQAINVDTSAAANVKEDPTLRNAQMQALTSLQQRAQVGLNPEDRARLNQIQEQVAQQTNGRNQAILQSFQQRGQAGSGNELLAALQNSQAGTQNSSDQGLQVAAQASQNALAALGQGATLAGQVRGQDFSNDETKANAQDQMNRFNVQNQQSQQARNVAAGNNSQLYNLQNNQQISNANTNQYNQEQLRQTNAEQQMWQDQFQKAAAVANAYNGQATSLMNQANASSQQATGIGSGISTGLGSLANAYAKNPKLFSSGTTNDINNSSSSTGSGSNIS